MNSTYGGRALIPVTPATGSVVNSTSAYVPLIEQMKDEDYPGDWRYFAIVVGIIVIIFGTIGNGITLGAYKRNRSLQTSFNVLIANLCCVELFYASVIIPLSLPGYFLEKNTYPDALCQIIGYLYYTSLASSLQNLVAIAVNRYVGIVKTKSYQKLFSGKRLAICVASIWIVPPLLYLPVIIGGVIGWQQNTLRCSVQPAAAIASKAISWYNSVLVMTFQSIALILLITLYWSIMSTVKVVSNKLKKHSRASRSKDSKGTGTKNHTGSGNQSSGDELDDIKPASMLSGGFMFRPAQTDNMNPVIKINSQSLLRSDNSIDMLSPQIPNSYSMSTNFVDNTGSNSTYNMFFKSQPTDKQTKKHGKRSSLWKILFVKTDNKNTKLKNKSEMQCSQDFLSHSQECVTSPTAERSQVILNDNGVYEVENYEIILRRPTKETIEIRRKHSLSAPLLQNHSSENLTPSSRKASAEPSIQELPEEEKSSTHIQDNEKQVKKLQRTGAMHSSIYQKKSLQKTFTRSYTVCEKSPTATNKLLEKLGDHMTNMPNRTLKMTASTPALHEFKSCEDLPRSRMNTITKKIWDQKSKKFGAATVKRKKTNAERKKHAREKQLVNSSLVICIAFAICIMPTALIHIIEATTKINVSSGIKICVSSIAWLHAVVNPFIYGYMNRFYRKEFKKIASDTKDCIAHLFKCSNEKKSINS